jgi:hypothetical protein
VELSGNKTAAQLGLMASDGVVANPIGQTTGTLTALEVGGTKYAVGGGSGTSDYTDLTNKPSINGVTLSGNKTTSDLGITASGVGAIPSTDKGANGGVAELDSNGKVPSSQLPSYVDDVLSYASQSAFPATGETGKIYIAEDTNKTYRWSGSVYAEISESLALGETSSTAYRGDRGKAAYDHSQTTGNPHGTTASQVMMSDGVTSVEEKLSGYIAIQNTSPSSALTWTNGDFTYFNSYKPSDTNYTWYLLNVMPATADIIVCGIQSTAGRVLVYLPAGGSIQAGCNIAWLGVKN